MLTNVEGRGCAGGSGDVPLMPVTEAVSASASPSVDFRHGYAAGFSHRDEQAGPGFYRVRLANRVEVDLAAGMRDGLATFGFPTSGPATVLIRTSDSEVGSSAAESRFDAATGTVSGSVTSGNFCGYIGSPDKTYEDKRAYYTLHFTAHFDVEPIAHGTWQDAEVHPGASSAVGGTGFGPKGFPEAGHGSGVYLSFSSRCGGAYSDRHLLCFACECGGQPAGGSSGGRDDRSAGGAGAGCVERVFVVD